MNSLMIRAVYLITKNPVKLSNAKNVLKNYGIEVRQVEMDVPELQSSDVTQVAEYSARHAGNNINQLVVKLDVAFEIRALNGFPGPFVKYVNRWLSPEKILQLMENENDRYAKFVDCVALYEPDTQQCRSFISQTGGRIADEIRGQYGWGIDKLFIPDGCSQTLASYSDSEKLKICNQSHWQQVAEYLRNNSDDK